MSIDSEMSIDRVEFVANNATRAGALLYQASIGFRSSVTRGAAVISLSRFEDNHGAETVLLDALASWECFPGQWSPPIGSFPGDFSGCAFQCPSGSVGTLGTHTMPTCDDSCPCASF